MCSCQFLVLSGVRALTGIRPSVNRRRGGETARLLVSTIACRAKLQRRRLMGVFQCVWLTDVLPGVKAREERSCGPSSPESPPHLPSSLIVLQIVSAVSLNFWIESVAYLLLITKPAKVYLHNKITVNNS